MFPINSQIAKKLPLYFCTPPHVTSDYSYSIHTRQFNLSKGDPLGLLTPDYFTLSNAG